MEKNKKERIIKWIKENRTSFNLSDVGRWDATTIVAKVHEVYRMYDGRNVVDMLFWEKLGVIWKGNKLEIMPPKKYEKQLCRFFDSTSKNTPIARNDFVAIIADNSKYNISRVDVFKESGEFSVSFWRHYLLMESISPYTKWA